MSNTLSQTDSLTREELDEMLGNSAGEIGVDQRDSPLPCSSEERGGCCIRRWRRRVLASESSLAA